MNRLYRTYPEEVLQKLQQAQRDIYRDFARVCQKYDLPFFAIGGTLLGAVRHQGYIPWDDDMDLGMLRKDWDRFLEVFDREMGGYNLICPERNGAFYSFVPKIEKKGTVFQPELAARSGQEVGIYIEVFVFENTSPDQNERKAQIKRVGKLRFWIFHLLVRSPYSLERFPVSMIKNLAKRIVHGWARITGKTAEKLDKAYLVETVREEETGVVAYFSDWTTEDFLTKKEDLFPLQEVPFDDTTMPIPANARALLQKAYINYEELPPEEDRWNHAPRYIRFADGEEVRFDDVEIQKGFSR